MSTSSQSSNKRVKVKQDDLRRLMKERREDVHAKKQKIDSPLAKYNETGKLYCISCNIQIKSEALWANHIISKIHKDNIQKKKKKNDVFLRPPVVNNVNNKGRVNIDNKLLNQEKEKELTSMDKDDTKRSSLTLSLNQYSSSDEEDQSTENSQPSSNTLPTDFFDVPTSSQAATVAKNTSVPSEENVKKDSPTKKSSGSIAESLPEGFFDNPVLDAKVRNIEYKDPVEEEWERFQKTIEEETNLSKTIMEEDVVESTVERNIEQIDQQIHHWETVKSLQSKFEEECLKTVVKPEDENSSDSGDEEQLDDLLNWRSKGVKR